MTSICRISNTGMKLLIQDGDHKIVCHFCIENKISACLCVTDKQHMT